MTYKVELKNVLKKYEDTATKMGASSSPYFHP